MTTITQADLDALRTHFTVGTRLCRCGLRFRTVVLLSLHIDTSNPIVERVTA